MITEILIGLSVLAFGVTFVFMKSLSRLMEIKEEQLELEKFKHTNDLYICEKLDDILEILKGGAKDGKNKNK